MQKLRKSVFDELEKVKKIALDIVPDIEENAISDLLGKLGQYHYKKRKLMLLGQERKLYNTLIENSFNPYTAYKWSLLERIPEDIKFQLKNGFIGQKKASKIAMTRRRETESGLQIDIRQRGLMLVRGM